MGVLARCLLAWCALGCTGSGKGTAEQAAPSPPSAASPTGLAAPAAPGASEMLSATGLARVKLDDALPPDLAVAERYYAGFYADAQPLEGFTLGSANVLAIVEGGAFAAFGTDHPGQPAPDDVRARTLAAGTAGTLTVRMLVVTDPAVPTASGVRVGTDLAAVRVQFPNAALRRLPPLWEDPTCIVEAAGLTFFFSGCPRSDDQPPAQDARVVRIVARR